MKVKSLVTTIYLLVCGSLFAQSATTEAYIKQYKDLAISEMQRTGVPAAIKLAQAILESQSGMSTLALTANNHFGIKCKAEWTGGKVYQDDDERGECFRVYPSVEQSFKDHSDFLKNRPYYTSLFKLDPTDMQGWAYGLKKAGYATSVTYPKSLLKIIKDYDLEKYNSFASVKATPQPVTAVLEKATETVINDQEIIYTKSSLFPRGIFTINRSKVIFAIAGTTLKDIALQYDVRQEDLLTFNDIPYTEMLTTGRLIFLEKKLKTGSKSFRIAQPGETWRDISQLEGIRLEHLLLYNQASISEAAIPSGQKIWLQPSNGDSSMTTGSH
jgi:hypothetical protein